MKSKIDVIDSQPVLRLRLVAAPDDLPLSNPEYQTELRDFYKQLKSQGMEVSARYYVHDALRGGGGLSGEFTLIITTLAPVITGGAAIAGAWLHARYGRKLHIKFDDVEVEAPTMKDLKEALQLVEESKQRNKPKIMHEP